MELNVEPFDVLVFEAERHPVSLRKISGPLVGRLGLRALSGELLTDPVLAEALAEVASDGRPRAVHHTALGADGTKLPLFTQIVARRNGTLAGLSLAVRAHEHLPDANGGTLDALQARVVLERIPEAVTVQAPDGQVIFANESAAAVLGFRNAREVVAADMRRYAKRFEMTDESGAPLGLEQLPGSLALGGDMPPSLMVRWRRRDRPDDWHWSDVAATPIVGEDGRVVCVINIWSEVTEKRRTLDSLRFQRALLQAQNEASPDGVLIVSPNGKVLSHNRRFLEIWGLDREEVEHGDDQALLDQAVSRLVDPEAFRARVEALYGNQESSASDELKMKDGRILERYTTLLLPDSRDDGREPLGRIWFFRDVTTVRRAEERERVLEVERATRAAAESAQRNATFLAEASRLLAQSLDLTLTMAGLAEAAAAHFGAWVMIDVIDDANTVRRAVAAPSRALEPIADALRRRPPRDATALLDGRFPEGEPEVVQGVPGLLESPAHRLPWLVDAEGPDDPVLGGLRIRGYLSLPITVHRQLRGALTLAFEEPRSLEGSHLRELGQSIAERLGMAVENAQLYDRVREALRIREEFVNIASHELRTPVATLQLLTQGMLRSEDRDGAPPLPEPIRPKLRTMERQCRRMGVLVGRLLDITRMSDEPLKLDRAPMDLADVTRDVVDAYHDELTAAGCPVTLHADRAVEGNWDRPRIEEVLAALISNAALYGRGKPVEIFVGDRDGRAWVEVVDHGIGVPPEATERIFQRFERAVDPIAYTGFGLGLYIAKRLIDAMEGTISVHPTEGGGSTFRIELPMTGAAAIPSVRPDAGARV